MNPIVVITAFAFGVFSGFCAVMAIHHKALSRVCAEFAKVWEHFGQGEEHAMTRFRLAEERLALSEERLAKLEEKIGK